MNSKMETDFFNGCSQTKEHTREILKNEILAHALIITDMPYRDFKCSECFSNNLKYRLVQSRSMDEGPSSELVCIPCNKSWRVKS